MRLSWYADTGVAVFSIWQGGTCTGTFRLPIADLPRMVEALQRGPHGNARGPRDARGTAEQRGRADPRGGQPHEPGPEPDTGYSDPGFSVGHGGHQPGYGEEPPREYLDPPGRRHRGEPASPAYREDQGGEYRPTGRYDEETHRGYGEDSLPGGYRSEPGSGYPAPGGYEDEPTGVYRGDAPTHGYRDEPGARYRDADYPDDPLTGRYPVADPHPAGYPGEDSHPARYQDDPLTGRYHEDPHTARYPEEDPHPARYPEDPLTGDYPDGSHPGDYATGPASSGNDGYSPARPYVAPVTGGTGPVAEGRGQGRRRAADREESDLSPDSFPYGGTPAEPEPRRRGR